MATNLPIQTASFDIETMVQSFMAAHTTTPARITAVEDALRSPAGSMIRTELAKWIVQRAVPVEILVPKKFEDWRAPVRDAMTFVVMHLSSERLAPKIVEQMELPRSTRPETRLLKLISKVPGIQKLGQVLARNRHLRSALRIALSKLENGIRDVDAATISAIIKSELGTKVREYEITIGSSILSEASVSAVVRFTWRNPSGGNVEHGVFKVIKPHIPVCFREDMHILQALANFFGKHRKYGFSQRLIPDTFRKVRRLLQREVNFPGEQAALREAAKQYRRVRRLRMPKLIEPLCTSKVTAMSEEHATKITTAAARLPFDQRQEVAEQLVDAVVAFPLFNGEASAIFHADPHAGNLMYNVRTRELILLDWALTEHLSREQRRHVLLLFVMVALRNPAGARREIVALAQQEGLDSTRQKRKIRSEVERFFDDLPLAQLPRSVDAMRLLEQVALSGVRFPAELIMFSKVLFTLDGVLQDIGGASFSADLTIISHLLRRWVKNPWTVGSPLKMRDWIGVQLSAFLLGSQLWVQGEQRLTNRIFGSQESERHAATIAEN